MNSFVVIALVAPCVALGATVFLGRKKGDFVFLLCIAILAGFLYVSLPWLRGGDFRVIASIPGIRRLGIFMCLITFFAFLFRSQRK